jgi:hypothetical protein
MADAAGPDPRDLVDPFSVVTRAERRSLLVTNLILFAVVFGGLTPSRISALGIETTTFHRRLLVALLIGVAMYFLCAFLLYARADLQAWHQVEKSAMAAAANPLPERPALKNERGKTEFATPSDADVRKDLRPYRFRSAFDYYLPLIIGVVNPVACMIAAYR